MLQTLPTEHVNAIDIALRRDALKAELSRKIKERDLRELRNVPGVLQPVQESARYKALFGGRGSGKSHTFAELLLSRCLKKRIRAVCVREFQVTLEHSVKQLLEDKIHEYEVDRYFRILNTHIETPEDGIIIFQGMRNHTAESIKSLEGYDIAWFEEAQTASEQSLKLLTPTLREDDSEIWFSWNPRREIDPVDNMFRGNAPPREGMPPWKPMDDAIVIESSYKENHLFPKVLQKEVARDQARDPEKYAHVWLGGYERKSEARVFKNWEIAEFPAPDYTVSLYYGGDWGYSVDPAVLVRCFIDGRKLFIDHEAYQVGCEIDHIPSLFDRVPGARQWTVIADSSRPDTISYLRRNGFPKIEPAKKGKDSVKEGVIFLQSYDIVVHPRCKHTIDELTLYSYKTDQQTGMVLPVLEDKKNHVIDSLRYATERLPRGKDWATW